MGHRSFRALRHVRFGRWAMHRMQIAGARIGPLMQIAKSNLLWRNEAFDSSHGGKVWHFTEVCLSGGKLAPIQNFTAFSTEANFISVYMGLYPVPSPSFFSQLAGKEKWSPDTHVIKCLRPTTAFVVHGCNSDWLFLAWVFMPYLMYCFDNCMVNAIIK
jgi:hypothetical protein